MQGYQFWKRIENLNQYESLKVLAKKAGLNYPLIKNQRSAARLLKILNAYILAKMSNTSIEYLLTDKNSRTSQYPLRGIRVADKLCKVPSRNFSTVETMILSLSNEEDTNKQSVLA